MEYRTVSTRLSVDEFTLITDYCKRKNTTPSALIKELLFDEISPTIPANVAGKNVFDYDKKKDTFSWSIVLDDGRRYTSVKDISPEYVRELCGALTSSLASRSELQGKKHKNSVPVPKKLIRVKK